MINRRKHFFPENDCTVITGLLPTGEFGAYREQDDGLVRGHGHSRLAAIADLVEQLEAADDLPEDHRTPFSGEDAAQWQADRRRAEEMAS